MRIIGIIIVASILGCTVQSAASLGAARFARRPAAIAPVAPYSGPATATTTYGYGTGVFINGDELGAEDKAALDDLVGDTVAPGRYTVDAHGNAGPEGQAPVVNLVELARARQQRAGDAGDARTDFYGSSGSVTSSGDCMMVSSPGVDFASSGC